LCRHDQRATKEQTVDISDAIEIGKAYVRMGWAVQEQLEDVLDQGPDAEINANCLDYFDEFLRTCEDAGVDVDDARGMIDQFKRSMGMEEES